MFVCVGGLCPEKSLRGDANVTQLCRSLAKHRTLLCAGRWVGLGCMGDGVTVEAVCQECWNLCEHKLNSKCDIT